MDGVATVHHGAFSARDTITLAAHLPKSLQILKNQRFFGKLQFPISQTKIPF
jgi:hypothetical protein